MLSSSFGGSGRDSGGRSAAHSQVDVTSSDISNNRTSCVVDMSTEQTAVVTPSAVVSGGMMTLPSSQHQSANDTTMSPWQRGPMPTDGGRALTRAGSASCSYGVSSPCCKLLPAANVASSTHVASSSCHLRSVTLPRGHPAMYTSEIAARLRPPPPPSAAAIRQAAQRASLAGPAGKTLDVRSRSHGRAGAGFKTTADSNTEQRRSVSTVIV